MYLVQHHQHIVADPFDYAVLYSILAFWFVCKWVQLWAVIARKSRDNNGQR